LKKKSEVVPFVREIIFNVGDVWRMQTLQDNLQVVIL
jgi:hypothetical protein